MRKLIPSLMIFAASVACSSDDGGGGSEPAVEMTSAFTFDPEELTVQVGDTVKWTNDSSQSHTVTAYGDELPEGADYFASGGATSEDAASEGLEDGLIDEGETFELTFDVPGTYEYFCIPHESQGMVGTIVVEG